MDFSPYLGLVRDPSAICLDPAPDAAINAPDRALLFVSDVAEFPLSTLTGQIDLFGRIGTARAGASVDLDSDLRAFLAGQFTVRSVYSGPMGHSSSTQYVTLPSQIVKLPFQMRYQRGGELLIRTIGMLLSEAVVDLTIDFYAEGSLVPLHSFIVTIAARSLNQFSVGEPWRIPMDGNRYELRASLPVGVRVADNNISCGCGSMRGLPDLLANCCSGKASGFMLTLAGACSYDPLLEQLLENDRTRLVIAYMMAYQTAYRLLIAPASGEIERATVLSQDDLKSAAAVCRQEYLNRLGWLKAEVPKLNLSADNTCFQAPKSAWSRGGIFS